LELNPTERIQMMTTAEMIQNDTVLQREWFSSYESDQIDFIYDGATVPDQWVKSPWRIMCLLKEAHGGGVWNHAEAIREDGGLLRVGGTANQAVHYRMVEWLAAIESSLEGAPIDIEADREEDYPKARATMLRSAWVNVKKVDGLPYSNAGDLHTVATRDADFLKRQMDLLNPRVIVCGATFGIVREILFPGSERIAGTEFSYRSPSGIVLIDYGHPGRKARESYQPLIEEIKCIQSAGYLLEPDTAE
jgi:hypothetical protein